MSVEARSPWRLRVAPAILGALLGTSVLPVVTGSADTSFTFAGGGYGHSVGLSQFGAYGMAREGATWQEIMTHYFTGATPGPVDPATAARPLWVNLQTEQAAVTFTVRSTGDAPAVPVEFRSSAGTMTAAPGDSVSITRSGDTCTVSGPAGTVSGPCTIDAEWDGWSGEPTTALVIAGCTLINWNTTTGSRQQPCTYARGSIRIRPDNNTKTVAVSLEIGMEDYVLGISEMPYFWAGTGGMAALEAQAVSARSYAYARMISRGAAEARPWCWCHMYDTPVDQNYVGWGHGSQDWIDAVRNTSDQVMFHPAITRGGSPTPLDTFYSSSTFGATENSENSFTAAIPYLRTVDDHWAGLPQVYNGNFRWSRNFASTQLASSLGMGSVTGVAITRCSSSGAALEVTFSGSGGPRTVHVRQLRGALGLRSQQLYAINGSAPCGTPTTATTVPSATTTTEPEPTTTTTPQTTTEPEATTTTTTPQTTTEPEATTTTTPQTTTAVTVPEATATTTTAPTVTSPTSTTSVPVTTTTVTTTTQPTSASCPVPVPIDALMGSGWTLRPGAQGLAVTQLQQLLTELGHYQGTADGVYGRLTTAAVRSFQDSRRLFSDGIVGSRTRSELMTMRAALQHERVLAATPTLLRRGAVGDQVKALQALLRLVGFDPGPADGTFGIRTGTAVTAFQRAKALQPDGVIGTQSRVALAAALGIPGC